MKYAAHPAWHHNSADNKGLALGLISHQQWNNVGTGIYLILKLLLVWIGLKCKTCHIWHHINSDLMGTQLSSAQKSQHLLDSTRRQCSYVVLGFLALPKHHLQETGCQQQGCRLSSLSGGARRKEQYSESSWEAVEQPLGYGADTSPAQKSGNLELLSPLKARFCQVTNFLTLSIK